MKTSVDSILSGEIKVFGPKGELSAYCKSGIDGPVNLGWQGLEPDHQADRANHGGDDKALLQYCSEHYHYWIKQRPEHAVLLQKIGAFGENISAQEMHEENVFIGDRFQIGDAIVEVSQGRQPCWKLGHFFSDQSMVKAVVDTAKGGWYYRVIETGHIAVDSSIELLDRPFPNMSVKKAFDVLVARKKDRQALEQLVEIPALSKTWAARAKKMNLRYQSDT